MSRKRRRFGVDAHCEVGEVLRDTIELQCETVMPWEVQDALLYVAAQLALENGTTRAGLLRQIARQYDWLRKNPVEKYMRPR